MSRSAPISKPTYAERFGLARWQTCPVCFGKGKVAPNFYAFPGVQMWSSANTAPEECRSCGGRGIVR